jgi:REP element-mobilizing transposase RayT
MQESKLIITQRRLPHWTLQGSTYYVSFHLMAGELTIKERQIVLEHVKSGNGRFYDLSAAVIMPDHVHLIFKPLGQFDPSRILKGIKGVSARLLNQHRNTIGHIWQDESWDHILRNVDEYDQKLQYMYDNPFKAGLVADGDSYEGCFFNPDFV